MMKREIYLDNSATTKPFDDVTDLMYKIQNESYGNPSSMHLKGIEAERLVNYAREIISVSLNASPSEIFFTSGGTESNNIAIRGYLEANPRKGMHIIASKIEHPSVIETFKYLERIGYKVDLIDVDSEGKICLEHLKNLMCKDTALISCMLVNNETGTIQPIDDIVSLKSMYAPNAILHVDAVQAFGKFNILPKHTGIDLLSISSHKIHGPKGVGALYSAKNVKLKPILFGGGQEAGVRSGSENVPGICGFGLATKICFENAENVSQSTLKLKLHFIERLNKCTFDYQINTSLDSSPYILNVSFAKIKSEVLLHHLEQKNIFVSTGSACSSKKK